MVLGCRSLFNTERKKKNIACEQNISDTSIGVRIEKSENPLLDLNVKSLSIFMQNCRGLFSKPVN